MPKLQTYNVYTILAAGGTKTYDSNEVIDVYEINANGGTVTLLADMIFSYSGTPNIGAEFKFQYGGGVTQSATLGRTVSFFGTDLTDAQALVPLLITAYWNGASWEITIVKDPSNNVTSVTTFGSTPNTAGLSISSGVLNMQPADATNGGGVSITTQTFAGAKTFSILSGNFSIDSNGIGIGTAATSRVYINAVKTFTAPLTTITSDILNSNVATFAYSSTVTEEYSSSVCLQAFSSITGIYSPRVVYGMAGSTSNSMTADLTRSISVRGSHLSGGSSDGVTVFNANFAAATVANKSSGTAETLITNNYDFYSSVPYQNNNTAAGDPALFTITKQYGFYCENYTLDYTPVIAATGSAVKVSATITDSWQLYMAGTSLTTIGSYIGNRLGVGFATQPTTNSQVTALLHIGAGTTSSAQIRLAVATAAPTAPNDGDIWFESNTNTGLKIRINGVTKTVTVS